jgi:nitronate monooxygenase
MPKSSPPTPPAVSWPDDRLIRRLGLAHPIVLAPMAGGPSTPELAAAVSSAGGLGQLGATYLAPDVISAQIDLVRERAPGKPFGVNLFVPEVAPKTENLPRMAARLAGYHAELGIDPPRIPNAWSEPFDAQVEVALRKQVPVMSFHFAAPGRVVVDRLKAAGTFLIGSATTVEEARFLAAAGFDAIHAQGAEAGGHRGTWLRDPMAALVGTMALVPQIVDAVDLPVIAAGGIMDARGIVAALALGASAVQMGTAFLACPESGAHPDHKRRIPESRAEDLVLTRAFSGRPARGISNRFIEEMAAHEDDFAGFPAQNALTRPLRNAAAQQNRPEFLSMWAGQGAALAEALPAADLVAKLAEESRSLLGRLARGAGLPSAVA